MAIFYHPNDSDKPLVIQRRWDVCFDQNGDAVHYDFGSHYAGGGRDADELALVNSFHEQECGPEGVKWLLEQKELHGWNKKESFAGNDFERLSNRRATVKLRRGEGWNVKPEAEILDGRTLSFDRSWDWRDGIYDGETTWVISCECWETLKSEGVKGAPTWLASGDLQFID